VVWSTSHIANSFAFPPDAFVFRIPHVSEITVWAYEHRSQVSEQPIIAFARQVNACGRHRMGKGSFILRALQPDPTSGLEEAVECRPRTVLQHYIHVEKTLPAYSVPMLPARSQNPQQRVGG